MRSWLTAVHYWTGLLLSVFILTHLANHLAALWSVAAHLEAMTALRRVYRQPVVETALLLGVVGQVVTGLRLYLRQRQQPQWTKAQRVQVFSGLYLAFFLLVHTGAVLSGRFGLGLDTNLYFAAAGLNTFPFSLFFVPNYFLAVAAVFLHLASLHYQKGLRLWGEKSTRRQALGLGGAGLLLALLILLAMTNYLQGLPIPAPYLRTLGK